MIGLWFLIIILAYLFFSISYFGDKLILTRRHFSPATYAFYVGVLNSFLIFLIPFVKFSFPDALSLFWIILDAIVFISGIYAMFSAMEKFEVSEVMPVIGALQPIFIFILTILLFGYQSISSADLIAFAILLLGSLIISIEKLVKVNTYYLKVVSISALMFSMDFVFLKKIFLTQPFWQGLIWTKIFTFIIIIFFVFNKSSRNQIIPKKVSLNKKTASIFLLTQSSGAIATILQNFAIWLVPVAYLAVMNSLRGLQYVFLFALTLTFSIFFPKILKEEISRKSIIRKTISILLIVIGLAIILCSQ